MEREKNTYIQDQIDSDYVARSKSAGIGTILTLILFFFLNLYTHHQIFLLNNLFLLLTLAVALHRIYRHHRYEVGHDSLEKSVFFASLSAFLNGVLWLLIGLSFLSTFEAINIPVIISFIFLISFSAVTPINISHKKLIFLFFNIAILVPPLYFAYLEFKSLTDHNFLMMLSYAFASLLYIDHQGNIIQRDLRKRFSTEYDLKKSLIEIAESKKQLEEETIKTFHASRLSSLGEMAGGVAHEINNPLTVIMGMTKLLQKKEEFAGSEEIQKKLAKIQLAGQRIVKIVTGMKTIASKNDHSDHQQMPISDVIHQTLGLFEEKIKNEGITLKLHNDSNPHVKCNPVQISQIIINLLSNAIDAIGTNQKDQMVMIKVHHDGQNNQVKIKIINNGPLIPKEVVTKIFEPFFTTKGFDKGTGLGLSISQSLAKNNGGYLSYEEDEGMVCFSLHLSSAN